MVNRRHISASARTSNGLRRPPAVAPAATALQLASTASAVRALRGSVGLAVLGATLLHAPILHAQSFSFAFGERGSGPGQFNQPFGVAVNRAGNIYVSDLRNVRVQKFAANGSFQLEFSTNVDGNEVTSSVQGVAVEGAGKV